MTIKNLRTAAGMTQQQFSEYFNIPKRSIENWEGGQRKCPEYLLDLIYYKLSQEEMLKEGFKMKKFEIRENTIEVKREKDITPYCSLEQQDQYPEIKETFFDKESAIAALSKYRCRKDRMSGYWLVTEFYVEENEYDEDGDWCNGGDVWAIAEYK